VTTYVALLRGVNVGGAAKIRMHDLRALIESLGYDNVTTYVQSGNVVFTTPSRSAATVAKAVKAAITRDTGLTAEVLVRTARELGGVVAGNPLVARDVDATKLHVTFLQSAPLAVKVRALDPTIAAPDRFEVVRREVYLHCPNGYGRTKLDNTFFEKRLGVVATTRSWKTVRALADLTHDTPAAPARRRR
jgi:uncharacterized protein (DUF1697 family)